MKNFSLIIISETKSLFSGQATYCKVTTPIGSLGFEANHEAMLGVLKSGSEIQITDEKGKQLWVDVSNGIFMFRDNTCVITVGLPVKEPSG